MTSLLYKQSATRERNESPTKISITDNAQTLSTHLSILKKVKSRLYKNERYIAAYIVNVTIIVAGV